MQSVQRLSQTALAPALVTGSLAGRTAVDITKANGVDAFLASASQFLNNAFLALKNAIVTAAAFVMRNMTLAYNWLKTAFLKNPNMFYAIGATAAISIALSMVLGSCRKKAESTDDAKDDKKADKKKAKDDADESETEESNKGKRSGNSQGSDKAMIAALKKSLADEAEAHEQTKREAIAAINQARNGQAPASPPQAQHGHILNDLIPVVHGRTGQPLRYVDSTTI